MFGVRDMHLVPAACLGFGAHRVLKAPVPQLLHVLCLPCALSQVGTCLAVSAHGQCRGPCSVLSGQMCTVPMVYPAQGPLPSDRLQLPTHLTDQSVTTSPPAIKGQGQSQPPSPFAQQPGEGRQGAPTRYAICGAMALRLRF